MESTSNCSLKYRPGQLFGSGIEATSVALFSSTDETSKTPLHTLLITGLFLLGFCVLFTRTISVMQYKSIKQSKDGIQGKSPPTAPYYIPLVAHGFDLIRGSKVIAQNLLTYANSAGPVRFQIFGSGLYYVSDPDAIQQIWRESRSFTFIEMKSILLERSFGVPTALIQRYRLDDSGTSSVPRAGSSVALRDRYLHVEATMLRQLLGIQSVRQLSNGYARGVAERAEQLKQRIRTQGGGDSYGAGDDDDDGNKDPSCWLEMPCLWHFLRDLAFASSLDSFCGPDLLRRAPGFLEDFWTLDENITKLSRKLPRWMIPNVYRARDTCRAGIQAWRKQALSDLQETQSKGDETDKVAGVHWGVQMLDIRDKAYDKLNLMDSEARAAFDLALIWASHSNPVAATFWMLYEVLSSPELYKRSMIELSSLPLSSLKTSDPSEAIAALGSSPLLQAIFAETLRLYVTTTMLRRLKYRDFDINGFRIPQNSRVLYSAHAQHMNPKLWAEGSMECSPPIEEFCPDRFLTKLHNRRNDGAKSSHTVPENTFSLDGLAGTYLPFGGGLSICPGREYAKDQALTTFALLLTEFEFEVPGPQRAVKADLNRYGAGTLIPERKRGIKFRVREKR